MRRLASSAGNSYIKARVRDWYRGQKRLGPSARSFAPFLPQTLETQELPAEEAMRRYVPLDVAEVLGFMSSWGLI